MHGSAADPATPAPSLAAEAAFTYRQTDTGCADGSGDAGERRDSDRAPARAPSALDPPSRAGALIRRLDRILPVALQRSDIATRFRARLLLFMLISLLLPASVICALSFASGVYDHALAAILRLLVLLGLLLLLQRTASVALIGNLLGILTWLRITELAARFDAVLPLMILAAIPLGMLFIVGRRSALCWLVASLVTIIVLTQGFDLTDRLTPHEQSMAVAAPILFCISMFLLGWACDGFTRRAVAELSRTTALALENERRALAAENERTQALTRARLVEASRLASLGTLAAGVAHEINNPLAVVTANVQFLNEDLLTLIPAGRTDKRIEAIEMLSDARSGADRIRRIVRDLNTFSHAERDEQPHAIDVAEVLRATINLSSLTLNQRARIRTNLVPVPPVWGHSASLAQVFLNLLKNAAEAIPTDHGDENKDENKDQDKDKDKDKDRHEHEISISLTHQLQPQGPEASEGWVVVTIRDTGCGIVPALQARVFEPFFTTKPNRATGLGLSICHGLIAQMNGHITVTSAPDRGSRFQVFLPSSAHPAAAAADGEDQRQALS